MKHALDSFPLILTEAAVVERLHRRPDLALHPDLIHAPLLLEPGGRAALAEIYHSYIQVAQEAALPMLLLTPTWRADRDRLRASGLAMDLNQAACSFLQELRLCKSGTPALFPIGGLIGCRGDAYRPAEALGRGEARAYHRWQLEELKAGACDLLIAQTLPALSEALGIGEAMRECGLPFIISFVIDRRGRLLDGTALDEAIDRLDQATEARALGYMVNCAWPGFLQHVEQTALLRERLLGIQANGSSLDHAQLDGATELQMEPVPVWADAMLRLRDTLRLSLLGGCCGTDERHLRALVARSAGNSPGSTGQGKDSLSCRSS